MSFYFKLVWRTSKHYLFSIIVLPAFSWLQSMISVILTRQLLDNLEKNSVLEGGIWAGIMLVSFFGISTLQKIVSAKETVVQQDLHTKMRSLLAEKYVSLPYHITCRHAHQEEYEMAIKCVDNSYVESFVSNILNIVFGIGTIGSLLYLLREFPIWLLSLFIVVLLIDIIVYLRQSDLLYANYIDETPIERGLYYSRGRLMRLEYAKEIRLYGLKDFISQKTENSIIAFFKQSEKVRKLEMLKLSWSYLAEAVQYVGIYAVAITEYYKNTSMTIGEFSLILTSTNKFSQTMRSIAADAISIYKSINYIEMLEKFLSIKHEKVGTKKQLVPLKSHHFCFDRVSFRYDVSEDDVLKDITVEFNSDEKISVVGENGAGKTTFVMLLLGLLKPTKGTILVDGIDVNNIDSKDYISLFSTIFQDYVIYNASIRDNIILSQNYEKALFFQSVQSMKLNLNHFPQGENTNIGTVYEEDGVDLSGGESQKIALARAIYKQSAMFVLDEPTAALDPRAEYDLYLNFQKMVDDRGCVFISHRLSSCKLCEKIFVFKEGKIVEKGSHETLMKYGGVYHTMFTAQSEKFFNNGEGE